MTYQLPPAPTKAVLREIDPDGPILRMHVLEYGAKMDACTDRLRAAEAAWLAAQAQYQYEHALIEINYHGPRWLIDGKVGGWDELLEDEK